MKSGWLYIMRILMLFIPESRCFAFKRWLLRKSGAIVGDNVRVCSSAMFIGTGCLEIGENTWIGHKCLISVSSNVKIGANCDLAPMVYIGTGTHEITPEQSRIGGIELSKDIKIGDGCWLCAGCIILPGVRVGKKGVIAAGAVVVKDTNPYTINGGVPARQIKQIDNEQ